MPFRLLAGDARHAASRVVQRLLQLTVPDELARDLGVGPRRRRPVPLLAPRQRSPRDLEPSRPVARTPQRFDAPVSGEVSTGRDPVRQGVREVGEQVDGPVQLLIETLVSHRRDEHAHRDVGQWARWLLLQTTPDRGQLVRRERRRRHVLRALRQRESGQRRVRTDEPARGGSECLHLLRQAEVVADADQDRGGTADHEHPLVLVGQRWIVLQHGERASPQPARLAGGRGVGAATGGGQHRVEGTTSLTDGLRVLCGGHQVTERLTVVHEMLGPPTVRLIPVGGQESSDHRPAQELVMEPADVARLRVEDAVVARGAESYDDLVLRDPGDGRRGARFDRTRVQRGDPDDARRLRVESRQATGEVDTNAARVPGDQLLDVQRVPLAQPLDLGEAFVAGRSSQARGPVTRSGRTSGVGRRCVRRSAGGSTPSGARRCRPRRRGRDWSRSGGAARASGSAPRRR